MPLEFLRRALAVAAATGDSVLPVPERAPVRAALVWAGPAGSAATVRLSRWAAPARSSEPSATARLQSLPRALAGVVAMAVSVSRAPERAPVQGPFQSEEAVEAAE